MKPLFTHDGLIERGFNFIKSRNRFERAFMESVEIRSDGNRVWLTGESDESYLNITTLEDLDTFLLFIK